MHCDDNPKVFVIIKIEGMCEPHAEELKKGIEKVADYVIRGYMALKGGRAERIPIGKESETRH